MHPSTHSSLSDTITPDKFLSVSEVALSLNRSIDAVRDLVATNQLPAFHIGTKTEKFLQIRLSHVQAFLGHKAFSTTEPPANTSASHHFHKCGVKPTAA